MCSQYGNSCTTCDPMTRRHCHNCYNQKVRFLSCSCCNHSNHIKVHFLICCKSFHSHQLGVQLLNSNIMIYCVYSQYNKFALSVVTITAVPFRHQCCGKRPYQDSSRSSFLVFSPILGEVGYAIFFNKAHKHHNNVRRCFTELTHLILLGSRPN